MVDKKISAETAAAALDGTELLLVVQAGANAKTTAQDIADLAPTLTPDNDTTLSSDSTSEPPTVHAVKTFVSNAVVGLLDLKGTQDCSANPNYPAASKGDAYIVSVAGKIGGASGISVDVGDLFFATADNAGGTQAAVGSSWASLEHNGVFGGGGASLAVKDEGTTQTSSAVSLNFTGSGVTATDDGSGHVTVSVPGGGSGVQRLNSAYASVGTDAATTEKTLQSYTLPGGTLVTNGQAVRVTVRGKYANTTRSRQLRLYFGSTVVTFYSNATGSAFNVALEAIIMRTGATTQIAFGPSEGSASNTTSITSRFIEFNDPAETLASDVIIKVTGQSGTGAVANDVTCDLMMVELLP